MTGTAALWLLDLREPVCRGGADDPRDALSAPERARADRLASPASAERYVRARTAIRRVLAATVGGRPGGLRIAAAPGGRPVLVDHPRWCVSWSRSAWALLVAVRRDEPIGADVEVVRHVDSGTRVLGTVYPGADRLGDLATPEAFFSAWTLLEAAVKATGRGLARGGREVRLVRADGAARCELAGVDSAGGAPWWGRTRLVAAPRATRAGSGRPAGDRVMVAVVSRGRAVPLALHAWPAEGPSTARTVRTTGAGR
ncbi:4'-phosphopantetheinyl transferase superfamily protein [Streptomyces sp. NPDC047315]|uniref:4'-phosphopantetheinyl transferase family protein n=1 Tax=Streptomyces sp. NPDC047315 TaxID=3155142 RepID=UPI00340A979E